MKLKINDTVRIIAGKDKGRSGKITKVYPKQSKVIVEGINKYKRHLKRQSDKNPGGIVEVERPIWANKVQLVCPVCKKPTRIGIQISNQSKQRFCKQCQAPINQKSS